MYALYTNIYKYAHTPIHFISNTYNFMHVIYRLLSTFTTKQLWVLITDIILNKITICRDFLCCVGCCSRNEEEEEDDEETESKKKVSRRDM